MRRWRDGRARRTSKSSLNSWLRGTITTSMALSSLWGSDMAGLPVALRGDRAGAMGQDGSAHRCASVSYSTACHCLVAALAALASESAAHGRETCIIGVESSLRVPVPRYAAGPQAISFPITLKETSVPDLPITMITAVAVFVFTLTLVIWQPRGLSIGWSATIGATVALLIGVVQPGDILVVWGVIWRETAAFKAI